jgi:hypothetical protein
VTARLLDEHVVERRLQQIEARDDEPGVVERRTTGATSRAPPATAMLR